MLKRLCNVLHVIGFSLLLGFSLILLSCLYANVMYSVPDNAIPINSNNINQYRNLQRDGAKMGDWIVDGKLVRRSDYEIEKWVWGNKIYLISAGFFILGLLPFLFTYGLRYILTGNKHLLPFKESK